MPRLRFDQHHEQVQTWGRWTVRTTRHRVGATIIRERFTVHLQRDHPPHGETLTGFASLRTALDAARRRVEWIDALKGGRVY